MTNRLKTVTYEAGTATASQVSYAYDLVGNRLTEQAVTLSTSTVTKDLAYDYDAINRLDTIDDLLGTDDVAYTYDANGNTLTKAKAGFTTDFLYDLRNQLGEVRQDVSVLGRYGYDSEGLRILKIGDDGIRRYTYDQLSVITEANSSNTTVSKYDNGLDQLVSLDNTGEGRSFFHLDLLGTTTNLTDGIGGTRQSILHDAWGNERDRVGVSANKFTFTGHEKDQETGLIYAKARFYDPDVGRFLNQDPLLGSVASPPSLHRYAYVFSNPFRYVDPDGRQAMIAVTRDDGTIEEVPLAGDSTTVTAEAPDFFGRRRSWARPTSKHTGVVEESSHRDTATGGDVAGELGKIFGGPAAEPPKFLEDALDTGAGYIHGAVIVFPSKTAKSAVTLVVSIAHLMWLDAKMKFGTDEIRREAAAEMSQINQAIVHHVGESAGYLGRGVQEPGAVADAIVELGPTKSSSILGESAVEGALVADGSVRLVQKLTTRRTVSTPWGTRDVATGKYVKGPRGGIDPIDDFAAHAEAAGYEVLGKEISVKTPFGTRRVDVVLRNPRTGEIGAVEVKSSLKEFNKFKSEQFSGDRWINLYGAETTGGNAAAAGVSRIESTIKILWEVEQ